MYHIQIHPEDAPHLFGMGGLKCLDRYSCGISGKDYYFIEFSEKVPRFKESEKNVNNIGTAIKMRRTPWGE